MGSTPDKIKASLWRELNAMYAQHMFTNGLATIQTDELHSYEDGLNVLGENMLVDFGSPKQIERAMVTAKRLEWLTGINDAGPSPRSLQLFQRRQNGHGRRLGLVKRRLLHGLPARALARAF